ncbi:hypothetical protein [Glaciibacter superstes]|uniref:hypothetical protein n=1 Tax=Glaciibacter superstes TaxID=501023 RepID=UPI0003B77F6E|nr:hypothetical protein [Glaciibacter superstes]
MGLPQWMWIWHLSLVTSVMVPFGILVHYWRRPDAAHLFTHASEGSPSAGVYRAVRRQVLLTRIASAIAFVVVVLSVEGVWLPSRVSDHWTSFLVPMTVATACILVLMLAPTTSPRETAGSPQLADSSARPAYSFGKTWWFVGWSATAAILAVTAIVAGLFAGVDNDGRHAIFTINVGEVSGSTTFLGWYFGVPILIGIAVLAAVTLVALWLSARRRVSSIPDRKNADSWLQHHRNRTILLVGAGALVVTLGWALLSISSAGSLFVSGPSGTVGSPFAALSIPLRVTGLVLQGVGVAMFLVPAFSKLPRSAPVDSDTPAADDLSLSELRP